MQRFAILSLVILALSGCTPKSNMPLASQPSSQPVDFGRGEDEMTMLIAIDLSGSFMHRMTDGGEGYEFATRVIDHYFQGNVGQNKLVIAQLSGTSRSLLYEGSPLDLRRRFPTPESFRDFLIKSADPSGSRIYDGLCHAVRYVLSDERVKSGKSRLAVFVLSDMLDTGPNKADSEKYLNHELSEVGWRNGAIGFYFVDQNELLPWRQRLQQFGVKHYVVEGEFFGQPSLPNFD